MAGVEFVEMWCYGLAFSEANNLSDSRIMKDVIAKQKKLDEVYKRLTSIESVYEILGNNESINSMLKELEVPFLKGVQKEYENSTIKTIIVGQENNGWLGSYWDFLQNGNYQNALEIYKNFDYENDYNIPFFQWFSWIRSEVFQWDEKLDQRQSVMWSNLFMFNQKNNPKIPDSPYFESILKLQEDVFQKEIEILEPDVVIFLTGSYEKVLHRLYPDLITKALCDEYPEKELAILSHSRLPKLSFRTYHPGYLQRIDFEGNRCTKIFDYIHKNT